MQRGLATAAHGTGETEDLDMGCRYGGQTGGASHDDSEWKRVTYRAHLQCAIYPKSKLGRSVVLRTTHHVLGVGWTVKPAEGSAGLCGPKARTGARGEQ